MVSISGSRISMPRSSSGRISALAPCTASGRAAPRSMPSAGPDTRPASAAETAPSCSRWPGTKATRPAAASTTHARPPSSPPAGAASARGPPAGPSAPASRRASTASAGVFSTRASGTSALVAGLSPLAASSPSVSPRASTRRACSERNSRKSNSLRTAWASTSPRARSSSPASSGTSRTSSITSALVRTCCSVAARFSLSLGVRSSREPKIPSSPPLSLISLAAVFSPTPGTPGRLSLGSPRKAAYCT